MVRPHVIKAIREPCPKDAAVIKERSGVIPELIECEYGVALAHSGTTIDRITEFTAIEAYRRAFLSLKWTGSLHGSRLKHQLS